MGLFTNLATATADDWPGWLQPVVSYAWLMGVMVMVVVISWWLWARRGPFRAAPRWVDGDRNPYPGLTAYQAQQAAVFAGRVDETRDLVERVAIGSSSRLRFVPVVGPSGAGKSSLVLAGLLSRLDARWRVLPDITPGNDGLGRLADVLGVALGPAADRAAAHPDVRAGDPVLGPVLSRLAELRQRADRLLIVVDQFEELATLHTADERGRFMGLLAWLVRRDSRLHVVATVRSEYIGVFQQGPGSELFTAPFMVNVMTKDQLRQVIQQPAAETDTTFDDGLAEDILAEAGGGDVLPLLSYFLSDLYDRRGDDHHISRADYQAAGTVFGIIDRRARLAVDDTGLSEKRCLDVLLAFVSLAGSEPTRQAVFANDLGPDERAVVEAFVEQRLITSDVRDGATVYAIGHEALLRRWDRMREHIAAHAEQLRRTTELAALAAAWQAVGRSPDYLVDGRRLRDLHSATRQLFLPARDRQYLTASYHRDRQSRKFRADNAARTTLAMLSTDPVKAFALAYGIYTELAPTPLARYALQAAMPAEEVLAWRAFDHVGALAYAADGRLSTGTQDGTVLVWDEQGQLLHILTGHDGPIQTVAFAADGRLASGSDDKTVRVWDEQGQLLHTLTGHDGIFVAVAFAADGRLATGAGDSVRIWDERGQLLHTLPDIDGSVEAVAFAPDGRLATGCRDGTVQVWHERGPLLQTVTDHHRHGPVVLAFAADGRLATGGVEDRVFRVWDEHGQLLHTLTDHDGSVAAVAFAADGRLATAYHDGTVRVWDEHGQLLHTLTDHDGPVGAVAFGSDGRLATGSDDRTIRVRGLAGEILVVLRGFSTLGRAGTVCDVPAAAKPAHPSRVLTYDLLSDAISVAFAADGRLAVASKDKTVRVWDDHGQLLHTLTGHYGPVRATAFAADGRLVTGSSDKTVRVWDEQGQLLHTLTGHDGPVNAVAFATDGRLATGSDNSMLVWDEHMQLLSRTLTDRTGPVSAVAFAADGRLATGYQDGRICVWDEHAQLLQTHASHGGPVRALAFAADGRLAAGSTGRTVRVWDEQAQLLHTLTGHDGPVNAVAFATDGRLATGSHDKTVRLWDEQGQLLHNLTDHYGLVEAVAFAADGRLATGDGHGRVRVRFEAVDDAALVYHARALRPPALTPRQRIELGLSADPGSRGGEPSTTEVWSVVE
ncbi:NACHT and WD repeat domain-containing protein [Catellatospora paridis]|uniref:NACHT and WD repeat domain-containing protein n=1 Tax=Catellatospora paridis TaxID=1617086 RepID=UPI0012D404C9|nr:WD40 repeat domain-containing protein [Catellatospora paridis]